MQAAHVILKGVALVMQPEISNFLEQVSRLQVFKRLPCDLNGLQEQQAGLVEGCFHHLDCVHGSVRTSCSIKSACLTDTGQKWPFLMAKLGNSHIRQLLVDHSAVVMAKFFIAKI